MKNYYLELILTRECNENCYYCNVHSMDHTQSREIDIDFLKYVLRHIPKNTMIEFCGGEPGLLTNLQAAYEIVIDDFKVSSLQIMSNGLVRKLDYEFICDKNVYYREHLVKEIRNTRIDKFHNLRFIEHPRWRYVIVTTLLTTLSLLRYFDYFKKSGFFKSIYWYKLMNPKTHDVLGYISVLKELFTRLQEECDYPDAKYTLDRLNEINIDSVNVKAKKMFCGWNSPQPTIDFQTKEIVHCGTYLEQSQRAMFTPGNFKRHLQCELFSPGSYCESCYVFSENRAKSIIDSGKGIYYNRGY